MKLRTPPRTLIAMMLACSMSPSRLAAQSTVLRVLGIDSVAVPFAWVSVEGAAARITDDAGNVSLGASRRKTLSVEVRRIGYQPWFGKLDAADTASVHIVMLSRLTQQLGGVTITAQAEQSQLQLVGFYDRWMQRQKGALSATFIGPEEIEKRHPSRVSDMLSGLNGVTMISGSSGAMCARGNGGSCFMTVLIDGNVLHPAPPTVCYGASSLHIGQVGGAGTAGPDINLYIDAHSLAAIEVYARGGNMPVSLQGVDNACGVLAIWTGTRR